MRCIKHPQFLIVVLIIWVCTTTAITQDITPDQAREAQELIHTFQQHYNQQNIDGILSLIHSHCEEPPREALKEHMKYQFTLDNPKQITCEIKSTTQTIDGIAVKVAVTGPKDKNPDESFTRNELYILKSENNKLLISAIYGQLNPKRFDEQTGIYNSKKAKFSLTLPAGWMALEGPVILKGLTIDSVTALAPDLRSKVMMGVLQMPLQLADGEKDAAQIAVEADMAMEKRECSEHRIIKQGPTTVAGKEAYRIVTEFKSKETGPAPRKRMRLYFSDKPMLYFFVCDAVGPGSFDTLSPQFEAIVQSFEMLPTDEGISRQEAMAAKGAKGSVAGRVYTSEEFNCFMAAPEGWEISTNPDLITQVQMQYTAGKSLARLIAVKNLDKYNMTLNDMFLKRLDDLNKIVQNFSESSRRDVTIAGVPGIESIHTFSLEALGRFHVKEVTILHNGIYYLILCQCIEPDDFTVLEKDFDRIIESFGFIQ